MRIGETFMGQASLATAAFTDLRVRRWHSELCVTNSLCYPLTVTAVASGDGLSVMYMWYYATITWTPGVTKPLLELLIF